MNDDQDVPEHTTVIRTFSVQNSMAILRDIGRSLHRIKFVSTEKNGLKRVLHQGKRRTELVSWEDDNKHIDRQEFCFFGRVVEFREKHGLRTGVVPEESAMDEEKRLMPRSELFVPHDELDIALLESAALILRECSDRDYFTQHMLTKINDTLRAASRNAAMTKMVGLSFFKELERWAASEDEALPSTTQRHTSERILWLSALILSVFMLIALLIFFVLSRP